MSKKPNTYKRARDAFSEGRSRRYVEHMLPNADSKTLDRAWEARRRVYERCPLCGARAKIDRIWNICAACKLTGGC